MLNRIREKLIISDWLDKMEKIFFSLFILSIPFQARLTVPSSETYRGSTFNEYTTFFLYLSDIFLLITLFIFFVNYLTKNKKISSVNHSLSTSPQLIPILCILGFVAWSFLDVIWVQYYDIALYRSFKLFELFLLFIYIKQHFYWFSAFRLFALVFITGVFQSIIGILQYFYQHSLGLKLLGESVLTPNIDNVAKIVVDGERMIRVYGTFPHPNIFGAFLILSIFSGIWLLLSFKPAWSNKIVLRLPFIANNQNNVSYSKFTNIVSRETILNKVQAGKSISDRSLECESVLGKTSGSQTVRLKQSGSVDKLFHVKQFTTASNILWIFLTIGASLQIYALLLTYSRIAWAGFIIITIFLAVINHIKLFHVKQFDMIKLNKVQKTSLFIIIVISIAVSGLYWNTIINRVVDSDQKYQLSIDNRILYNNIALSIIKDKPMFGVGNGNFTLVMAKYSEKSLEWWQHQPVHNIYLLIASELGVVGLVIFILFLLSIILSFFYAIRNNIIVSCLPAIASVSNSVVLSKQDNEIVSRETILSSAGVGETFILRSILGSIFVTYLLMGLFDHYFWSFQQGQIMFMLVIGVIIAISSDYKEEL